MDFCGVWSGSTLFSQIMNKVIKNISWYVLFKIFILLNFSELIQLFFSKVRTTIWASAWEKGTYHIGDQQRLRRACAQAQARQSLCCSQTCSRDLVEASDRKCMSVAQIGDCACAFEEPQTGKSYKVLFRVPAHLWLSSLTKEKKHPVNPTFTFGWRTKINMFQSK